MERELLMTKTGSPEREGYVVWEMWARLLFKALNNQCITRGNFIRMEARSATSVLGQKAIGGEAIRVLFLSNPMGMVYYLERQAKTPTGCWSHIRLQAYLSFGP